MRRLLAILVAAAATGFSAHEPHKALDPLASLRERASDNLPAASGDRHRTVSPHGGWTLVCDQDIGSGKRRCNLSQQIVDRKGQPIFGWTLAGERGREPVLMLRGMGGAPRTARIEIGRLAWQASLETCGPAACLALLPVGQALATALTTDRRAEITMMVDGRITTMTAPLAGLTEALATLR